MIALLDHFGQSDRENVILKEVQAYDLQVVLSALKMEEVPVVVKDDWEPWKDRVKWILMHESKRSSLLYTGRLPKYDGSRRKNGVASDEYRHQRR